MFEDMEGTQVALWSLGVAVLILSVVVAILIRKSVLLEQALGFIDLELEQSRERCVHGNTRHTTCHCACFTNTQPTPKRKTKDVSTAESQPVS